MKVNLRTRPTVPSATSILRNIVSLRRARRTGRAVRVGLFVALYVLSQPGYVASEGRHLRLGAAGHRPARRLCAGAARARRRSDDLGRRAYGAARLYRADWPPPRRWGFTRRSKPRAFSATVLTSGICRARSRSARHQELGSRYVPHGDRPRSGADPAICRAACGARKTGVGAVYARAGLTDDPANVEGIARFVAPMKNVEWVEVQPFHQLGEFKWKAMKLEYKHADTPSRRLILSIA